MKIFNRVFYIFLAIVLLVFVAVREFVESQYFASIVKSKLIYKKLDSKKVVLDFNNFEIGIIPLKTSLMNVEIGLPKEGVDGTFDSISFQVDFFDLLINEFTISELSANGGLLNVSNKNKKTSSEEVSIQDVFTSIEEVKKDLPFELERVSLVNSYMRHPSVTGYFKNISAGYSSKKKIITIDLTSENINVDNKRLSFSSDEFVFLAEISKKNIDVKKIKIKEGMNRLDFNGRYSFGENKINGYLNSKLFFKDIHKFDSKKYLSFIDNGILSYDGELQYNFDKFEAIGALKINDLVSSYVDLRELSSELNYKNEKIIVNNLTAKTKTGSAKVVETVEIPLNENFKIPRVTVEAENIFTYDIFKFLDGVLDPLKAFISGKVNISLEEKILKIASDDSLVISKPNLTIDSLNILKFKQLELKGPEFNYDFNKESLSINTLAVTELGTEFIASGFIDKQLVNVGFKKGKINLDELATLAEVPIKGIAKVDLMANGPIENVSFYVSGEVDNLKVASYFIGDSKLDLSYSIKRNKLEIHSLKSNVYDSSFSGVGVFDFNKSSKYNMDAELDISRVSYITLQKIIGMHLPEFLKDIKELDFIASGKTDLKISFFKPGFKITSDAVFKSLNYYKEVVPKSSLKLFLDNKKVQLSDVSFEKGGGRLFGSFNYDIKKNVFDYDFLLKSVSIDSFNLYHALKPGITGKLAGQFYGDGNLKKFSNHSHIKLVNTRIENKRFPNSSLEAYGNERDWFISWGIANNIVKGDSYLNFADSKKPSNFNVNFAVDDIKSILGFVSSHNIYNKNLNGRMFGSFRSSFLLDDPLGVNLNANVNDFYFSNEDDVMSISKNKNQIEIRDGLIKKWDIEIAGENSYFLSNGQGNLKKNFKIENDYLLYSKLLKVISPMITKVKGILSGKTSVIGNNKKVDFFSSITSKDLGLGLKKVPGDFEDINFEMFVNNKSFVIDYLRGKYGRGDFSSSGKVDFLFPYPSTNIKLDFKNVNYTLYDKSNLLLSGDLALNGNAPPYSLNGRVDVNKLSLLDDLSKLTKEVESSYTYSKYLPQKSFAATGKLLNFDFIINAANSIDVINTIISANLSANIQLKGDLNTLLLKGFAKVTPETSKLSFKGHEFLLSNGLIQFRDEKQKEVPYVQIEGNSKVDKYSILLSVIGNADNLKIDLRSEPALSQEDILSLLTFGYTSDVSRNLDEDQRQALTTMSLGGFLIDQLQIGKGLSNSLGLKFSVAPEFIDQDQNLIENRKSDTGGGTRRLRSSTRVKLESKIGKKTNVSVSSSLGAEDRQTQEVKINYNINENWSLQGVYENNTGEDETLQTNSVGGDVKFKWTFGK